MASRRSLRRSGRLEDGLESNPTVINRPLETAQDGLKTAPGRSSRRPSKRRAREAALQAASRRPSRGGPPTALEAVLETGLATVLETVSRDGLSRRSLDALEAASRRLP
mmetsp:Transcript_8504/g.28007  ORF Transcript_8504/g.28007 Transcript_8504/m.28007 type:complete len:109 (-) Transcript_8504:391-717(-)